MVLNSPRIHTCCIVPMLIAYDMSMCYESEVPEYSQLLSMYNNNRQYLCRVTRKTGLEQFGMYDKFTLCPLVTTLSSANAKVGPT